MSANSTNPGDCCPDCGMPYKTVEEYYRPPADFEPTFHEVSESDVRAEAHRDFECPVQRERDKTEDLEHALRYFGIGGTLAKLAEIVRANEHDAAIIWGDADRWIRRENERPVCCPHCAAPLGMVDGHRLRIGGASFKPTVDVADEATCLACQKPLSITALMAGAGEAEQPQPQPQVGLRLVKDDREQTMSEELRAATERTLETLTETEQKVIRARFALPQGGVMTAAHGSENTVEDVARHLSLTVEEVRAAESSALRKLRTAGGGVRGFNLTGGGSYEEA